LTVVEDSGDPAQGESGLEWDLDDDGVFGETGQCAARGDEVGKNPTFSAAGLDGPAQWQVAVRFTDAAGETSTDTATMTINNVPPLFDAGPDEVLQSSAGGVFQRAGIPFTDPGADFWTGTVNWGDSLTSEPLPIDQVAKSFDLKHSYAAEGTCVVTVIIDDGDPGGTCSDFFYVEVHLNTPPVVIPPAEPIIVTEDGVATIAVSGSDAESDPSALIFAILSVPQYGVLKDAAGNVVEADGTFIGPRTLTYEPGAAWEGEGSDSFTFKVSDGELESEPTTVAITIVKAVDDGGVTIDEAGIVRIGGTETDDVILVTHTGDGQYLEVIINGVVAGDVAYRFTDEALRAILADWAFGKTPDEESDDVLDETVVTDGELDMLTGSSGADWFIINTGDKITDFKTQNKDGDLITVV